MPSGYYRFPTIHQDTVVFVCEDDLWTVAASGGVARRLTSNLGDATNPALSPDGSMLAFSGEDEGNPEVYVMPAEGGPAQRLTYLGVASIVVGWSTDGQEIIFTSNASQPFARTSALYTVSREGGDPTPLNVGPALTIDYGADGGAVLGRNVADLARWKRYRGGRTGDVWIDRDGSGAWQRLIKLPGNLAKPLWVGERVYFVSDHEGIGNLYSCTPTGEDLRRHTHHDAYYVRNPATDGKRIVYHAGADLFVFDPATNQSTPIEVTFYSPQVQRKRKFVSPEQYWRTYTIHPAGHSLAINARGKVFAFGNWEGAVVAHGDERGRSWGGTWLHDGKRIVFANDAEGEERLEVHTVDGSAVPQRFPNLDIGRPSSMAASPKADMVALTNHRNELVLVNLQDSTLRVVERSPFRRIRGIAWSPDGKWLAYGFPNTSQTSQIKLYDLDGHSIHEATRPVLSDWNPSFDPEGKYLYFLSSRDFDPIQDSVQLDLNFPRSTRPFMLTLRADLPSPFVPAPPSFGEEEKKDKDNTSDGDKEQAASDATTSDESEQLKDEKDQPKSEPKPKQDEPLKIDLEGLPDRVVAFPVSVGLYRQVRGIKGKALFTWFPLKGSLDEQMTNNTPPADGKLEMYDFAEHKRETLIDGISSFTLSRDGKMLAYRSGRRMRVIKAGEKPKEHSGTTRRSGWIDLSRIRVQVDPPSEWRQMYRDAWRLQRDQFWSEDMSGVDWQTVYRRYEPLLDRIATRNEFSDLMWEMQGELGTSHAYEMGGDYRREPNYRQGFLGADLHYDEASDSYRVERVVAGDVWNARASSPLARPGINVQPGDRIVAVNGQRVRRNRSPGELLLSQAGSDVLLAVAPANGGETRTVTVKTLRAEWDARYRDWVDTNRATVHAATDGRVGYVHIPNMGPPGYAEFHRGYLAEVAREGLIVDVRYNGGGYVSQLIIEKLARQRLGYDVSRWGQPDPYPSDSVLGPIVALTNENAGSDGDIFSHVFKMLKLGPLIGTRTWGGVIGISPMDPLMDGGVTTQPEYSFWFNDVGWNVENYGTDPTIEVDIRPQDYAAGVDPQMDRALAEITRRLEENPPRLPDFGERPRLNLPTLPKGE